ACVEREHGIQRAMVEADLSVATLRLFSIGAFLPERPTNIALSGQERVPRGAFQLLGPNDAFTASTFLLHSDDLDSWVLSNDKIAEALPRVIAHWSELLKKHDRSQFGTCQRF